MEILIRRFSSRRRNVINRECWLIRKSLLMFMMNFLNGMLLVSLVILLILLKCVCFVDIFVAFERTGKIFGYEGSATFSREKLVLCVCMSLKLSWSWNLKNCCLNVCRVYVVILLLLWCNWYVFSSSRRFRFCAFEVNILYYLSCVVLMLILCYGVVIVCVWYGMCVWVVDDVDCDCLLMWCDEVVWYWLWFVERLC